MKCIINDITLLWIHTKALKLKNWNWFKPKYVCMKVLLG
jgi:hypothetical protein